MTATGFLPPGLSLFGLSRLEANLEAILGARVDLIPAADLKPGARARVERDLHAGRSHPAGRPLGAAIRGRRICPGHPGGTARTN